MTSRRRRPHPVVGQRHRRRRRLLPTTATTTDATEATSTSEGSHGSAAVRGGTTDRPGRSDCDGERPPEGRHRQGHPGRRGRIAEQAFGESMDDVPATTDMNFRNGAVAFAYVATLLLIFVDEGLVTLDDTIDRWMPTLPEADKVTLRMLTNQTTGISRLRDRPRLERRLQRRPVPHVHVRGAARLRLLAPAAVRARGQLELRPHELHDPRRDPRADRREAARRAAPGASARPDGPGPHGGDRHDLRDPEPGPPHVQLRTAGGGRDPAGGLVLRGGDVLEPAVGHADGRQPDHDDRRHGHDRRAGRHRRAALASRAMRR